MGRPHGVDRNVRECFQEGLARRAPGGDREAFSQLYGRHFEPLYDFAVRLVLDPEAGGAVVGDTFARVWDGLRRGSHPADVRAWMLDLATRLALEGHPKRNGAHLEPSGHRSFTALNGGRTEEEAAADGEVAELAWEWVSRLSVRKYSMFDSFVRQGIEVMAPAEELPRNRSKLVHKTVSAVACLAELTREMEQSVAIRLLARAPEAARQWPRSPAPIPTPIFLPAADER